MIEVHWLILVAAALGIFLFGRWRGIRDFDHELSKFDAAAPTCIHGIDWRAPYPCLQCEEMRKKR